MTMNRDEYREIYRKFREADKEYRGYVEQFFTRIWEDQIVKKSTRVLTKENFKKIQELRKKLDFAKQRLDVFFGIRRSK